MRSNFLHEEKKTNTFNLSRAMEAVDVDLQQVKQLINWCKTDDAIQTFLAADGGDVQIRSIRYDAYEELYSQMLHNSAADYFARLMIIAPNHLTIQHGSIQGMTEDASYIMNLPYFYTLGNAPVYQWIPTQHESFFGSRTTLPVLPICRFISLTNQPSEKGYIFASLDLTILTDKLEQYILNNENLFLRIDSTFYAYSNGVLQPTDYLFSTLTSDTSSLNGSEYVSALSSEADWEFYQLVSYSKIYDWVSEIVPLLIAFFIISLLTATWLVLNKTVSTPIMHISERISRITTGDLSKQQHCTNSTNELSIIESGIDTMTDSISRLLDEKVRNEQTKRDLEISVLQNQINPHFLYNTLNTIKWMATIQGATGIAEISTALGSLLRSLAHDKSKTTTLAEELDMLKTYMTIQQYRFGDIVNFQIHTDDGYNPQAPILRLLLQPLIENAIFHGLEPKGIPGDINLYIYTKGDHLLIEVSDTGVGIAQDKFASLLPIEPSTQYEQYVGLRNVHLRLKHEFGEDYGLHIQSKVSVGTTITFEHPFLS